MDPKLLITKLTPRDRFNRWYKQRSFDLQCRHDTNEEIPDEHELAVLEALSQGSLAPWSPLPAVAGEIRLLDFSLIPEAREPFFVAIIEIDADTGMATLVPAAPYMDPATPFELVLLTPPPAFQVLQVWNLRRFPTITLEKSWKTGLLEAQDLENALTMARANLEGVPLPPSLTLLCGRPVFHREDPRHDYLEEQSMLLNHLQAKAATVYFRRKEEEEECSLEMEVAAGSEPSLTVPSWRSQRQESGEGAIAAAGPEQGKPEVAKYHVGDTGLVLRFMTRADGEHVDVEVLKEGGPPVYSMDGASILSSDGSTIILQRGRASCPRASIVDGFALIDADGQPIEPLSEVE